MSSLRCCEYRELEGKTIRRVRWSNDLDCHDMCIAFSDGTQVSFKLSLALRVDSELFDALRGTSAHCRSLIPTLVPAQDNTLENR